MEKEYREFLIELSRLGDVLLVDPKVAWKFHKQTVAAVSRRSEAVTGAASRRLSIIPIVGFMSEWGRVFGGTSTQEVASQFDAALRNPGIEAVVLMVDSPGGETSGTQELSDKIYASRGQKPIVAVASSFAASAAFWVASAADKFFVTPGGSTGSVGVWTMHEDVSKFEERLGIKTTLISSGKYKVEGHPFAPLDEGARREIQRRVDATHERFIAALARNRVESVGRVRTNYGEGRLVDASSAAARGMCDGLASLETVLRRTGIGLPVLRSGKESSSGTNGHIGSASAADVDLLRRRLRLMEKTL
jgi:signal peptide peptidase SppA